MSVSRPTFGTGPSANNGAYAFMDGPAAALSRSAASARVDWRSIALREEQGKQALGFERRSPSTARALWLSRGREPQEDDQGSVQLDEFVVAEPAEPLA